MEMLIVFMYVIYVHVYTNTKNSAPLSWTNTHTCNAVQYAVQIPLNTQKAINVYKKTRFISPQSNTTDRQIDTRGPTYHKMESMGWKSLINLNGVFDRFLSLSTALITGTSVIISASQEPGWADPWRLLCYGEKEPLSTSSSAGFEMLHPEEETCAGEHCNRRGVWDSWTSERADFTSEDYQQNSCRNETRQVRQVLSSHT